MKQKLINSCQSVLFLIKVCKIIERDMDYILIVWKVVLLCNPEGKADFRVRYSMKF